MKVELVAAGLLWALVGAGCDDPAPLDETKAEAEEAGGAAGAGEAPPAVEGGLLRLEDAWGEGLEIDVRELRWVEEGTIGFQVNLVEPVTRRAVSELDATSFRFSEDGIDMGAEALFEIERAKDLRVVLVLDVSRSLEDVGAVDSVRRAARALVESLPREAQVAIVGFSTGHRLLQDFSADATEVMGALEALSPPSGRAGQFTNLWGAVRYAGDLVAGQDEGGRAVVVFTDGRDNVAEASVAEALESVQAADAAVYAVGLGEDVDVEGLGRLAGPGRFTATSSPEALTQVFGDIGERLGEWLGVTYVTPKLDGRHTLEVQIDVGPRSAGFSASFVVP